MRMTQNDQYYINRVAQNENRFQPEEGGNRRGAIHLSALHLV